MIKNILNKWEKKMFSTVIYSLIIWIFNVLFVLYNYNCWVMEWIWASDDNLFQWLSTQPHYLPLQLDITSFETAWNYIYLLKWAINVRMAFPEDGAPAWESFVFSSKKRERERNKRQSEVKKGNMWGGPCHVGPKQYHNTKW